MAVVVRNLTKTFGSQYAVNDISFEARDAQILGFLGPNGAGKSTTMKLLTGYLQADSGVAECDGMLDYASRKGWVDESRRRVRAHLERG